MNIGIATALACGLLLSTACTPPPEPQERAADTGRPETRGIEAADPLGFEGAAIRKKVDRAIELNNQSPARIDETLDKNAQ
jgi:hypothetical protein